MELFLHQQKYTSSFTYESITLDKDTFGGKFTSINKMSSMKNVILRRIRLLPLQKKVVTDARGRAYYCNSSYRIY